MPIPMPISGIQHSARQVPVELIRYPLEDSTVLHLELRYGTGGKGKACWWPDVPRCWPQVEEVRQWFLADMDSLGKPFAQASEALKDHLQTMRATNNQRKIDAKAVSQSQDGPISPPDQST